MQSGSELPADSPIRWGIVATGGIAGSMAPQLRHVTGAELIGVASRSASRAAAFAAQHGIERSYGSYSELFADPDIDVVYIATPHAQHHGVAREALRAGKHLLVEKSFTCRLEATEDIVALAREKRLFMMEGMKTRLRPLAFKLRDLIAQGAIGQVQGVRADLGFATSFDPSSRLWDPRRGGGAMLDVGVYCVSFAHMLLGAPESVQALGRLAPNGVDGCVALQLGYGDGRYAQLACSLSTEMIRMASVCGTEGSLVISPPFHHMAQMTLTRVGSSEPVELFADANSHHMVGELEEVTRCIREGRLESSVMPLDDTVSVMRIMDIALDQLGAERSDEGFGL